MDCSPQPQARGWNSFDRQSTDQGFLQLGLLLMMVSRASCVSLPNNWMAIVVTVSPARAV